MRICKIEGCFGRHKGHDYCEKHLERFKKHGDPNFQKIITYHCKIKGCVNPHHCKGYCQIHYKRAVFGSKNLFVLGQFRRKYFFNESLLLGMSNEIAYFLGWILTDGCVADDRGAIILAITDKDILEKFRDWICKDIPIRTFKNRGNVGKLLVHELAICSRKMTNDIIKLGILPRKSLIAKLPNIEDRYFWALFRGMIEGDGSIIMRDRGRYKEFCVSYYSSSLELIEEIKEKTKHGGKIKSFKQKKWSDKLLYSISWHGKNAVEVCENIYKNCGEFKLNRKYNKYIEYKNYLTEKEIA